MMTLASKNIFLILSFGLLQSCVSSSLSVKKSSVETLQRDVASQNIIDKIPFPSGEVDPKTFLSSKSERDLFLQYAIADGKDRGMEKADCGERESGYWDICFIYDAENIIKNLPAQSPLKKVDAIEMASMMWYADFGSSALNQALRTMDRDSLAEHELRLKLMISGLNRASTYTGPSVRCDSSRANDNETTEKAARRYSVGEVFQTKSFFSTSLGTSESYIEIWLKPCRVQLNIYQHGGGVLIESLSSRPDEQEILVKPLTKYKVIKKQKSLKNGDTFYEIDLEELN